MRYEVTRAWQGVSVGDVVETDTLHDALKPNVRELPERAKEPEVEAPRRGRPPKDKE
jgi:hypothetical protein